MICRTVGCVVALSFFWCALPRETAAQAVPPEAGTHAVSFRFPTSDSGQIGIRRVLGSGANAGLNLSFSLSRIEGGIGSGASEEETEWSLGLHPDLRLYRGTRGRVLPFFSLDLGLSYRRKPDDAWAGRVSGGTGVGVEWFPVPSMSLSGTTGVELAYERRDEGDLDVTMNSIRVSTLTSSLSVNLYF